MPNAIANSHCSARMKENPAFLTEQIITYLGNKRNLLDFIGKALHRVKSGLGKEKLSIFDVFSGSGVVSRYFKRFADRLYVNDLEAYSCASNECYLANKGSIDLEQLRQQLQELASRIEGNLRPGFITQLYAPKDDAHIQKGERVFYTTRNAMYIDTARQEIDALPHDMRKFFLAPLLYSASVHTNTAGVFKGFYKNHEGVGQFGGTGRNALTRILGNIELMMPVFSRFECDYSITQKDAAQAALEMPEDVDLAYLDPPYNQHPYGSNYFMLNLILDYRQPQRLSPVSGIPAGWRHSKYNRRQDAQKTLFDLIESIRAKYILISYNSEGFIGFQDFVSYLSSLGKLKTMSTGYNTFRGSRNLRERDIHVKEHLFLLEK